MLEPNEITESHVDTAHDVLKAIGDAKRQIHEMLCKIDCSGLYANNPDAKELCVITDETIDELFAEQIEEAKGYIENYQDPYEAAHVREVSSPYLSGRI